MSLFVFILFLSEFQRIPVVPTTPTITKPLEITLPDISHVPTIHARNRQMINVALPVKSSEVIADILLGDAQLWVASGIGGQSFAVKPTPRATETTARIATNQGRIFLLHLVNLDIPAPDETDFETDEERDAYQEFYLLRAEQPTHRSVVIKMHQAVADNQGPMIIALTAEKEALASQVKTLRGEVADIVQQQRETVLAQINETLHEYPTIVSTQYKIKYPRWRDRRKPFIHALYSDGRFTYLRVSLNAAHVFEADEKGALQLLNVHQDEGVLRIQGTPKRIVIKETENGRIVARITQKGGPRG